MKHPYETEIVSLSKRISDRSRYKIGGRNADIANDLVVAAYSAKRTDFESSSEATLYYARIMHREATRRSIRYASPVTKRGNDVSAIAKTFERGELDSVRAHTDYDTALYYEHVSRIVNEVAASVPDGDVALRVLSGELRPSDLTDDAEYRQRLYKARRKLAEAIKQRESELDLW